MLSRNRQPRFYTRGKHALSRNRRPRRTIRWKHASSEEYQTNDNEDDRSKVSADDTDTLSQGPQSSSQSSQNGDSVISDEEEQLVDDEDVTWNMAEDEDLAMESGRGPTSEQSWDYDRRGDRRGALHSAGSFDLSQGNTTSGYESDALDSIEQQAVGLDDTLDAGVNDLVDYDCNQDLRSSTDPLAGGEQDIYNDDLEPSSDTSTSYPKEDTHSSFRPSSFQVQNSLNAVNESPPANQMRSPSQMPEEIEQDTATTPISPFLLALGLWFEKTDSSRQDYIRLRQILLLNEHPEHQALPLKLDTLKRHVRAHLPLLKMYRKLLTVMIEKQPSIAARQKSRTRPTVRIVRQTWMYWFDPVHLACSILNSDLKNKMHTGMAHYVDEPTELWHSLAWGSSIRACSGEICQSPGGEHILPGDIVCINNIYTADQQHISRARVTFIGRDYRSNAQALGTILLTCQAVVSLHQLRDCEAVYNTLARNHHPQELFLIENESFELPPDRVEYIDNILLDYSTFADDDVLDTEFLSSFIRRVVNTSTEEIRALRTSHPTRGELECAEYGRDYLVTNLVTELVTSLPLILFIDDFPVHRNMYRSLKAFYWIPASLPYHERRKIANVFTLTLGPHGADLKDVIRCLEDSCAELAKGTWIDDVGRVVCAFPMLLVGDMPQQADNSGFLRHNAIYGCRQCFCTKGERADLSFDISTSGRYHFDTVQDRELAKDLPSGQRRRFLQERGMHLEAPPMAKLAPALDLIRSRPADAPHSEWRGLGRILQGLLFSSIFTKRGSSAFLRHFQTFPYPPGWPRIQSPLYYIMSWSLSEAGRATVLTPLILRAYSQTGWYRVQFLTAITQQFPPSTTLSPIDQLIQAYGIIAICNTYTCTERYSEPDAIHNHILRSREAYQRLIRCADGACEGPHRRTNIDGDDLDQGPENVIEQALNQGGSETEHSASVNEDSNPFQARRLPSTSQRRRRQEQNRYRRLLSLPNVHQGLHYADVVREYAIVMNCNVLAGELKHKVFKHMADIAAPPNLMGYMFAKENVKQSMRLGFAGAWRDNEALHEAITVLSESCTALASSFIPQGEQDVGREDPGSTTVHGDLVHQHISATIPRLTLSLYIQALFQIRSTGHSYDISPLPLSHPFMLQLRKALARDYNINNVMRLKGRIQWKQRLAYTDPSNNRRWVFNAGDIIRVRREQDCNGRLDQLFVYRFHADYLLFVIVTVFRKVRNYAKDQVLGLAIWEEGRPKCFGLPALCNEVVYFVKANPRVEGSDQWLECDWGVDFM